VVDRVLEHYQGLRSGRFGEASRLSAADRQRLDAHMERLFELQRKLTVTIDCSAPTRPGRPATAHEELAMVVDLFTVALTCGSSHVAVLSVAGRSMSRDRGWTNWHEQIAHNGGGDRGDHNPEFQRINYRAQREIFEHAFLTLASQLDVDAGDGRTVLDDTLLVWTQESGDTTHMNTSMPVVTAGSAAGWFHTGRFVDYRNRGNRRMVDASTPARWPGTIYNRFLSNVLQSMGVQPADWRAEHEHVQPDAYARGMRGYGHYHYHGSDFWTRLDLERDVWPEAHYRAGDDPLPGLATGA
jgi:hypothetical protein